MEHIIARVTVYRSAYGDCTNGGISSRLSSLQCLYKGERKGANDAQGFTPEEADIVATIAPANSVVIVEDMCCGTRRLRAIPAALLLSGVWTMHGGNVLVGRDSEWFMGAVRIHDRVE